MKALQFPAELLTGDTDTTRAFHEAVDAQFPGLRFDLEFSETADKIICSFKVRINFSESQGTVRVFEEQPAQDLLDALVESFHYAVEEEEEAEREYRAECRHRIELSGYLGSQGNFLS